MRDVYKRQEFLDGMNKKKILGALGGRAGKSQPCQAAVEDGGRGARHAPCLRKIQLGTPRHKVARLYGIGVPEKLPKLLILERLPTR